MDNLRQQYSLVSSIYRRTRESVSYVFSAVRGLAVSSLFLDIAHALLPLVQLWTLKEIIDLLYTVSGASSGGGVESLTWFIGLYVGLLILEQTITAASSLVKDAMRDRLAAFSEITLLEKVNSFPDLTYFENPVFHDKLRNARDGAGRRFFSVVDMFSGVFRSILTLTGSLVLLSNLHWSLGLIAITGLVPYASYGYWSAKWRASVFRSNAEDSRFLRYYADVLTGSESAKEIRVFSLGEMILGKYRAVFQRAYGKMQSFRKRSGYLGTGAAAISGGAAGAAFAWLCWQAYEGGATVGDTVMYIGILPRVSTALGGLINCALHMYQNDLYLQHFFSFLRIPVRQVDGIEPQPSPAVAEGKWGFELRNVSFLYPGASRCALTSISCEIPAGLTTAIVGRNGAGKTTLAKLLLRLYDPSQGIVSMNGVPLQNYDMEEFRNRSSAVFQNYSRLCLTVRENILGDREPRDDNKIAEYARMAVADQFISKFPGGYDTMLGKQFKGGVELSGGEWQKIALARAFAKEPDFLIMDEPTSAIDPEAEHALFSHFRSLAVGKTAIIITHRLSSVQMADRIIVLDAGQVKEIGTHEELLLRRGLYHRLYTLQAAAYARSQS